MTTCFAIAFKAKAVNRWQIG